MARHHQTQARRSTPPPPARPHPRRHDADRRRRYRPLPGGPAMTRAALLPAGSDPFLNAYWLRHYKTWADSVDELHIAVCGPLPPEVMDYTRACAADAPNVIV